MSAVNDFGDDWRLMMAAHMQGGPPDDHEAPERICPVTGTYCSGEFCDDYGCAKASGFWDDEDEYL